MSSTTPSVPSRFPTVHIGFTGTWEPRVLKTLREDIELGGGDFRRIIEGLDPCLRLETEGSLKNVPKGFPADSPDAGFLKLKNFCLVGSPDESSCSTLTSPGGWLPYSRQGSLSWTMSTGR